MLAQRGDVAFLEFEELTVQSLRACEGLSEGPVIPEQEGKLGGGAQGGARHVAGDEGGLDGEGGEGGGAVEQTCERGEDAAEGLGVDAGGEEGEGDVGGVERGGMGGEEGRLLPGSVGGGRVGGATGKVDAG